MICDRRQLSSGRQDPVTMWLQKEPDFRRKVGLFTWGRLQPDSQRLDARREVFFTRQSNGKFG
jgi:hypothetical protein